MRASAHTRFELPADLSAVAPAEARGLARDGVRLLVADDHHVEHALFHELPRFLRPGDLLLVNTSATIAAAVDAQRADGTPVVVHFSTALDDGSWVVELRSAPDAEKPVLHARQGERLTLAAGAELVLLAPQSVNHGSGTRLWTAAVGVEGEVRPFLARVGRPIAYGYVTGRWPLAFYQTIFADEPGSAEMPSAARPFTDELVTRLVVTGVVIAPVLLHTGVSSLGGDETPVQERFRVPEATARLVAATRRGGGRVIAVGTTVARAVESAAAPDGEVKATEGWTDLVLGPDRPARVVDGLVTGLHAPDASHLLLLEAVADPAIVQRAYDAALRRRYLWHEFGDVCLLLPGRTDARG